MDPEVQKTALQGTISIFQLLVAAAKMRFSKNGGTESSYLKAKTSGTENNSPACISIYIYMYIYCEVINWAIFGGGF